MDEILRIFLTWQFMIFCLGLAAITFVIRKIFEFAVLNNPRMPGSKNSLIWRALLLPIAPVVNGALAGFLAKNYPYPEGLGASTYGRISFGLVAGLFSGLVYRVVIELLRSKMAQGNTPSIAPTDPTISNAVVQSVQVSINKDPVTPNVPNAEPLPDVTDNSTDPQ